MDSSAAIVEQAYESLLNTIAGALQDPSVNEENMKAVLQSLDHFNLSMDQIILQMDANSRGGQASNEIVPAPGSS
eukprot:CAMPEP_0113943592 /NCGR_PEP_ID=MMETSP1339-20121228/26735_1 /TAXON_ID=94617 /ORGANISM="Fibrocapsa japonica" /LENGTH=74 /DNA_ID=CAMNT_0000948501 /DNA_START=41 /DNA_END=265 /DNA_ORIENTATION=+ /assembly_acc=CAM_ASM_000762